ncbi:MAG: 16S rRNA (guanine(527)-N(7))-methyltransferase RsmG [Anaerolineales bacterium]|nr:16S rRNA (guanine(527)-N(7))-methyltransferase RsmG [Anaerolineales bacterium]
MQSSRGLLGVDLGPRQLDAFATYLIELIEWNRRFNLTAITDPEGIEVRHFLDSLTCTLAMDLQEGIRVVDVGTGAGFPGIPIKIMSPQIRLTLVEATRKKAEFCQHVIDTLSLDSVEVVHARAEKVGQDPQFRHQFDWALARAVAPLPVLVEYLLPLLRIGGKALAQKGETAPLEAQEAEEALGILGGHVDRLIPIELPGVAETRYLVIINKIAATPAKYPRRAGMPEKRPLGKKV